MFIINPDPYSLPCYRIGPFKTIDIALNSQMPTNDTIDDYFFERFKKNNFIYTKNGREAINMALSYYKLKEDDIVSIFTTSANFYISGCVTSEIEKFCKWSRKIEPRTRVIFVNHEFGYPYNDLNSLKDLGIPIIEDCAQSFFSNDKRNIIGTIGDFVIYSFPKMFPIQIGGLLVNNLGCELPDSKFLEESEKRYIKNVLSHYIKYKSEIIEKRLDNYSFLSSKFMELGFKERFKLTYGVVPGVFMFNKENHPIILPELKKFYNAHGVQCSVFYKEESFFIPVHQSLDEVDLSYFIEILKTFLIHSEK